MSHTTTEMYILGDLSFVMLNVSIEYFEFDNCFSSFDYFYFFLSQVNFFKTLYVSNPDPI